MNSSFFTQTLLQEETGYSVEVVANSLEAMRKYTPIFTQADKIVGAQFYYSNPILYLVASTLDVANCACLYGDYYLVNHTVEHEHDFIADVAAINEVFLKQIGSYREKHTVVASDFDTLHDETGLYLVAIDGRALT